MPRSLPHISVVLTGKVYSILLELSFISRTRSHNLTFIDNSFIDVSKHHLFGDMGFFSVLYLPKQTGNPSHHPFSQGERSRLLPTKRIKDKSLLFPLLLFIRNSISKHSGIHIISSLTNKLEYWRGSYLRPHIPVKTQHRATPEIVWKRKRNGKRYYF